MMFHHKQRNISSLIPKINIDGNSIELVTKFNFLGLTLDENLSFDAHLQKISNRISSSLGTLNRLKRILPQDTLLLLYNSLILPHLQYAILCWGKRSSRLFILQKKAMRYIVYSKYNAHTDSVFKKLELLKLDDIYNISLLKFYYKSKQGNLPLYFRNIMTSHTPTHTYLTRGRNDPIPTITRTRSAQLSFFVNFPDYRLNKYTLIPGFLKIL